MYSMDIIRIDELGYVYVAGILITGIAIKPGDSASKRLVLAANAVRITEKRGKKGVKHAP